jgi:hypothetical protein
MKNLGHLKEAMLDFFFQQKTENRENIIRVFFGFTATKENVPNFGPPFRVGFKQIHL